MPFDTITEMSPADEKRCAKALSPPVAWPTLALAVVLPLAQWTVVGLGAVGSLRFGLARRL